jgi:pimeloyl-ACP methyl ester carboxylesterase
VVDFGGPPDGPLVVLVHGLGGSVVNWVSVGPLLAERARVVALDLAGHGRTMPLGRRTDVRSNRAMLGRFLTECAGTPAVLVGNSMGGMLSLMQADAAPDTVAGMVLVDPALPTPFGTFRDPLVIAAFGAYAVPGIGEWFMAGRRKRQTTEQLTRQMLAVVATDVDTIAPEAIAAAVDLASLREKEPGLDRAFLAAARSVLGVLARPGRYAEAIRAVRQPTLLLHGVRDRLIPVSSARAAAVRRPEWRLELHPDAGHVPQLEYPEWTVEKIFDWFDREGAPAVEAACGAATGMRRPAAEV